MPRRTERIWAKSTGIGNIRQSLVTRAKAVKRQIPNREIKEGDDKKVEGVNIFPQKLGGKGISRDGSRSMEGFLFGWLVCCCFLNRRDLNMPLLHEEWQWKNGRDLGNGITDKHRRIKRVAGQPQGTR